MTDTTLASHLLDILKILLPDLWKMIPAAVLGLLAFGFRRMAARFLGLFERLESIDHKVTQHIDEVGMSFRMNDQAHGAFVASMAEHSARSAESIARIERAVDAQARRIDELAARK